MPLPVLRALLYTALTLLVALPIGLMVSTDLAWAVLCGGLLMQLAYHLWQWHLLDDWSRAPCPERELGGRGVWYDPFARIYRHERDQRREIAYWQTELARFGQAGQALSFGIIAISDGGRIEWCNRTAEQQLGLDAQRDLGEPITHLVRQPAFVAYLHVGDYAQPLRLRSERGREQILSIRIVPYGEGRHLIQVTDISQSERMEQMRSDFVANVSHELRTPLTVLNGFLETLRELDLPPEQRNHYLGLMSEQSDRMLSIVQDLLTLSTLESSPPPPGTERVSMDSLLDKLLRDARALSMERHSITLEKQGSGDLFGSESEITSALANLVTNAIRYTPTGGTIHLSWKVDAQGAEFAVQDSGIGIAPADIPRLTERFYRVDRGRSRETGGTGLGLAIVKHALSRHQAQLDIRSTPGKGSRFAARFPTGRLIRD